MEFDLDSLLSEMKIKGEIESDFDFYHDMPIDTTNGVMMGDPGTKGLLTLINLVAEEMARQPLLPMSYDLILDKENYKIMTAKGEEFQLHCAQDFLDEAFSPSKRMRDIDVPIRVYRAVETEINSFRTDADLDDVKDKRSRELDLYIEKLTPVDDNPENGFIDPKGKIVHLHGESKENLSSSIFRKGSWNPFQRTVEKTNLVDSILRNSDPKIDTMADFAGDDSVQCGILSKLINTRENLSMIGMKISKKKFFLSMIGAMYCERLILRTGINVVYGLRPERTYLQHCLIDSVKIRLLSPVSKNMELADQNNPAFGKASHLFNMNKWLPKGFTTLRDEIIPSRFMQRMYYFLPHLDNGSIDPIIHLPVKLGGLGIPFVKKGADIFDLWFSLSQNHKILISKVRNKQSNLLIEMVLVSWTRNRNARGLHMDPDEIDALMEHLSVVLQPPPSGLNETFQRMDQKHINYILLTPGYQEKVKAMSKLGYMTKSEIKRKISRSLVQAGLLTRPPDKGWKNISMFQRRRTYEYNMDKLVKFLKIEDTVVDDADITDWLSEQNSETLNEYFWQEDIFFSEDMKISDKEDILPIKALMKRLVTFELPPLSEMGWFNKQGGGHSSHNRVNNHGTAMVDT